MAEPSGSHSTIRGRSIYPSQPDIPLAWSSPPYYRPSYQPWHQYHPPPQFIYPSPPPWLDASSPRATTAPNVYYINGNTGSSDATNKAVNPAGGGGGAQNKKGGKQKSEEGEEKGVNEGAEEAEDGKAGKKGGSGGGASGGMLRIH